jgi:hypothetical protein
MHYQSVCQKGNGKGGVRASVNYIYGGKSPERAQSMEKKSQDLNRKMFVIDPNTTPSDNAFLENSTERVFPF